MEIIEKLLYLIFFLSVLNVFRHAFYFIQSWFLSDTEEPTKYKLNKSQLLLLGLSLANLLTSIFTGIVI